MKRTNIIIAGVLCVAITLTVLFIYIYSASQTSDIDKLGTFFGGIGSVIIGLITTVLLIITLFKQEEAGQLQSIKNETDFLLELYNQMERDYDNIASTEHFRESRVTKRYQGQEAVNMFVHNDVFGANSKNLADYNDTFEASQIHGVLKSYNLIKKRNNKLPLSTTLQTLDDKMNIFYVSKLEYACSSFARAFRKADIILADKSKYLVEFYNIYKDIED